MKKPIEFSPSIQESAALIADGFDSCVIGFCSNSERLVYSREKMIELLIERDNMSDINAVEFLEYNTWSADVGEHTPLYVWTDIVLDEDDGMWTEEEMKDFRNQFLEPEILEYEDVFKTAEFKSLSRWRRFVVRLRVALAGTFEMF
jgi:hypothetical protein